MHLQRIVGNEQCLGADVTLLAVPGHVQVPRPDTTQHGHQSCPEGNPAAPAVLGLEGFSVLQHFGIQAEARVDQEHPVIDHAHLHRPGDLVHQQLQRPDRIRRNAVRTAEVVEGALRQHAECATAVQRGLCHGVDGAIAARGHHHPVERAGAFDCLECASSQPARGVDLQDVEVPARRGAASFDDFSGA